MLKDERGLRYDRPKEIVTTACRALEIPDGLWVWLDLVCIPQGSSSKEEELRTIAINIQVSMLKRIVLLLLILCVYNSIQAVYSMLLQYSLWVNGVLECGLSKKLNWLGEPTF